MRHPFVTSTQVLRPNIIAGGTPSQDFLEACAELTSQWIPTKIRN
ncbi:hypothetical protein [Cerasicoccus maritimus]|nr:hypothetical protein [Cerasicoccus maritimus]